MSLIKKSFINLLLRPLFNYLKKASSWFLIGLIFFICLNFYISFEIINSQKLKTKNYNKEILLLRKNVQGGFNNSYLALSDLGLVNISSVQTLNVGSSYLIKSLVVEYELNNNTKPFDRYYRSLGIIARLEVKSSTIVKNCNFGCLILQQVNIFQNWTLRNYGQTFCQDNYTILKGIGFNGCQDGYALSLGLILGEDGYFTKELKTSFKKLGLTHLTAFSGMQTVLILALLEKFLINMKLSSNFRYFLSLLAMLIIILLAGFSPPVLRSILSILISMSVLKFYGRIISPYRCLVFSGALMCLINPLYIINISFQLSFLATLGVILSGIFELREPQQGNSKINNLNSLSRNLWTGFLQSGLCIIMTMPIILQLGSSDWLISLLANIVFVPLLNFLTLFNYVLLTPYINYILAPILVVIQSLTTYLIIEIAKYAPNPNIKIDFQLIDYIFYYIFVFGGCYIYLCLSRMLTKTQDINE